MPYCLNLALFISRGKINSIRLSRLMECTLSCLLEIEQCFKKLMPPTPPSTNIVFPGITNYLSEMEGMKRNVCTGGVNEAR